MEAGELTSNALEVRVPVVLMGGTQVVGKVGVRPRVSVVFSEG